MKKVLIIMGLVLAMALASFALLTKAGGHKVTLQSSLEPNKKTVIYYDAEGNETKRETIVTETTLTETTTFENVEIEDWD